MEVEVRLYANLRRYAPTSKMGEPIRLHLPAGATVGDLLAALSIPPDELKTVFVNNRPGSEVTILESGDRVALFPPIAGG